MNKTLKEIPGYEGYYMASEDGQIWSCRRRKFLMPINTGNGYYCVNLSVCGERKKMTIHRLIALAFIPNPMGKQTVNHKNEIKTDNRVENLEWATTYEQNIHGTRIKRARAHTDYKSRNINYQQVAEKHDYIAIAKRRMKPVKQLSENGEVLNTYESVKSASQAIKRSAGHIVSCAKGQRRLCGGYRWEYVN